MDRTNWAFGKSSINILMMSVVWNGMGTPPIWFLLPSSGCSSTQVRTDLLDQLKAAFPDMRVARLLGDREFIGDAWMAYLTEQKSRSSCGCAKTNMCAAAATHRQRSPRSAGHAAW